METLKVIDFNKSIFSLLGGNIAQITVSFNCSQSDLSSAHMMHISTKVLEPGTPETTLSHPPWKGLEVK